MMCSNIECNNVNNIKEDYCPECGAKTFKPGPIEGFRMINAKKNFKKHMDSSKSGFLICDKCKEYHEFQPGEYSSDFINKCNCGGKLNYTKIIDLDNSSETEDQFENSSESLLNLEGSSNILKRTIAITIGVIFIVVSGLENFVVFHMSPIYLYGDLMIGGFVVALVAGGSYKDGIFNGMIVTVIGILILFHFFNLGPAVGITYTNILSIALIFAPLGIIGGLIAIFCRKRKKTSNS